MPRSQKTSTIATDVVLPPGSLPPAQPKRPSPPLRPPPPPPEACPGPVNCSSLHVMAKDYKGLFSQGQGQATRGQVGVVDSPASSMAEATVCTSQGQVQRSDQIESPSLAEQLGESNSEEHCGRCHGCPVLKDGPMP